LATTDVTVMGAGIFGLSVAWVCARRGARVQVIDPAGPGAGASGGLVGALAPHVPENWNPKKAFQLDSLLMAEGFWAEVQAAGGVDPGYARSGRLQPVTDLAAAQARAEGAADLWRGQALWQVIPPDAFPGWSPEAGHLIHDTLTARLHPRRSVDALVAALRARGAEVTTEGSARGAVVWATGWQGLHELSETFGKAVGTGVKGQAATLAHDAAHLPQLYVEGLHIVPHADGTVAIGSTSEREFDAPDSTDAQLDDLIARARTFCPALSAAPVVARWAGVRPRARSRAPMLGAWPDRPGNFIANGGFKIGFGMAPKVGQVMADMMLEGRDAIPEGFRVEDCL
jgi:glycine oxidase